MVLWRLFISVSLILVTHNVLGETDLLGLRQLRTCHHRSPWLWCTTGTVIVIHKVGYTQADDMTCDPAEGCAIPDAEARIKDQCSGTGRCSVRLPSSQLSANDTCQHIVNALMIDFECVSDEHIFYVCNPFSRANTYMEGYLVSPGYPNQYRNNLRCDFHLQAPRDHQIHTRLVDMGLESLDGMACYDYLSMKKQGDSDEDALYYCGNMSNVHAQTTLVFDHFVLIHFVTDDVNIDKGFMLHFQFLPKPPEITSQAGTTNDMDTTTTEVATSKPRERSTKSVTRNRLITAISQTAQSVTVGFQATTIIPAESPTSKVDINGSTKLAVNYVTNSTTPINVDKMNRTTEKPVFIDGDLMTITTGVSQAKISTTPAVINAVTSSIVRDPTTTRTHYDLSSKEHTLSTGSNGSDMGTLVGTGRVPTDVLSVSLSITTYETSTDTASEKVTDTQTIPAVNVPHSEVTRTIIVVPTTMPYSPRTTQPPKQEASIRDVTKHVSKPTTDIGVVLDRNTTTRSETVDYVSTQPPCLSLDDVNSTSADNSTCLLGSDAGSACMTEIHFLVLIISAAVLTIICFSIIIVCVVICFRKRTSKEDKSSDRGHIDAYAPVHGIHGNNYATPYTGVKGTSIILSSNTTRPLSGHSSYSTHSPSPSGFPWTTPGGPPRPVSTLPPWNRPSTHTPSTRGTPGVHFPYDSPVRCSSVTAHGGSCRGAGPSGIQTSNNITAMNDLGDLSDPDYVSISLDVEEVFNASKSTMSSSPDPYINLRYHPGDCSNEHATQKPNFSTFKKSRNIPDSPKMKDKVLPSTLFVDNIPMNELSRQSRMRPDPVTSDSSSDDASFASSPLSSSQEELDEIVNRHPKPSTSRGFRLPKLRSPFEFKQSVC